MPSRDNAWEGEGKKGIKAAASRENPTEDLDLPDRW
jgi:hypothetical protein